MYEIQKNSACGGLYRKPSQLYSVWKIWTQVFKMVDPGFHFDGPRFFLEILVDPGLVDPGSEKLSFTLVFLHMEGPQGAIRWFPTPVNLGFG